MRKEAMDHVSKGMDLAKALMLKTKDSDIRERHFSTPLAVSSAAQSLHDPWRQRGKGAERQHPYDTVANKGKGKGKTKGKKGKGKPKSGSLHGSTSHGATHRRAAREVAEESTLAVFVSTRATQPLSIHRIPKPAPD